MKTIIISTQVELDALPDSFPEFTVIKLRGGNQVNPLVVNKTRESSHVVAWESSHVVARESSHVEAWESSHVVAWGNSHVVAWGNSHVVARESSHVVAWGNVSVTNRSDYATIELFCFAVAILVSKAKKLIQHSKNTTVVSPIKPRETNGWLDDQGVVIMENKVILFKRVSFDLKTQERKANETVWEIGSIVSLSNWAPKDEECGAGKFHACSRPYFCDEFRSTVSDKYIAIEINVDNLYVWPDAQYPHKIAFRAGKVLYQCDRYGKKIE